MDELRKQFQNDNVFLSHVAAWLSCNARRMQLAGSYADVYDAAAALDRAAGETKEDEVDPSTS